MAKDKKQDNKKNKKDLTLFEILFIAGSVIFIASAFLYITAWHITTII